ncbi:MAG: VCBS repeat-containing protein [Candidatus Kapaibacterium sp.]
MMSDVQEREEKSRGLWPDLRFDDGLRGNQPMPSNIQHPAIAWRHRIGGSVFDAHIFSWQNQHFLLLIYGGCIVCHDSNGKFVWKTEPCGIEAIIGVEDVDDDQNIEIVASNGRSFFVFEASSGKKLCEEYLGPPFAGGFIYTNALLHQFQGFSGGMQLAVGLLSSKEVVIYDFSPGASQPERRHILWMDDFFHPSILAVDIDNDGVEELLVTKLSSVFAFDPVTGLLKGETTWTSGGDRKRNYGLFEARDLSGNGNIDMLLLSYVVSRHVAVVENDGIGRLQNRWDRFIGHIYPHDETELRYCWNSCADIDNDGRLEIIFSAWNEGHDGTWQTEIVDAWSGEVRAKFPGTYLRGIFPGTSSTPPIIFLSDEQKRLPGTVGRLKLISWIDSQLNTLWEGEGYAPLSRFPRRTPTKTTFRIEHPPDEELWYTEANGKVTFFLTDLQGQVRLLTFSPDSLGKGTSFDLTLLSEIQNIAALVAIEDVDHDGQPEFFFSDWNGSVKGVRLDGSVLFSIETGSRYRYGASLYFYAKPFSQPIVVERNGERFCALPDGGKEIQIYRWNNRANQPVLHSTFIGRGRVGPEEGHHSLASTLWEGEPMLLTSYVGEGESILRLVDLDGKERNRWEVSELPANPPLPRGRTGIHEYRMVETQNDLLLFISGFRTGSMNSEKTFVLNAKSGEMIWDRTNINEETEAAFAPWNASTVGGHLENPSILFLAKDTFCEVDLRTGKLIRPPWQLRPWNTADLQRRGMSMDDFAAYGSPVPVQFSDGNEGWILLCNYGGTGAISSDHTIRWWRSFPLPSLTTSFGGVADVDNDSELELGLSLADGDFICLNASTGHEKWRLHLDSVAADVVTCDIDGDGRTEFILSTREGEVIVVGSARNGAGLIKWRLHLGFSLGPPIIADFDGDGLPEILVVSGDGYLCSITERK